MVANYISFQRKAYYRDSLKTWLFNFVYIHFYFYFRPWKMGFGGVFFPIKLRRTKAVNWSRLWLLINIFSTMFVNKKRPLRLVEIGITICINGLLRHPECMDVFHFPLTHHFLSKGYVSYRRSNMTVRAKHTDTPQITDIWTSHILNTVMSAEMCSPPFSSKWSYAQHFINW